MPMLFGGGLEGAIMALQALPRPPGVRPGGAGPGLLRGALGAGLALAAYGGPGLALLLTGGLGYGAAEVAALAYLSSPGNVALAALGVSPPLSLRGGGGARPGGPPPL